MNGQAFPLSQAFLSKLETLRLQARRRFIGRRRGTHLSPRRGTSLEFADFRNYAPGDDPRMVDWGLYARTDRLYVKVFHEEENLFGYLFVDASASMAQPADGGKFSAASRLALALSYVMLSSEDSVRVHRVGAENHGATPFLSGRRRLLEVREFLDGDPPRGGLALRASLGSHLRGLRRPGKAIFFSDLLFPPAELQTGLDLFRAARLDTLVVQVLGRSELAPEAGGAQRLVDAESGEERDLRLDARGIAVYLENLKRHRREAMSLCHRSGVQYALFDTGRDLEEFVLTELPALGLLRE